MISALGAPSLGAIAEWGRSPVLYEIGQLTLPARIYGPLSSLSPAARGAALVSEHGWRIPGLVAEATSTGQYAATVKTGLTPLAFFGGLGMHPADRVWSGRW